jgi:glutamate carboxypeptidase
MVMEPALADGRLKSSRRAVGHFVLKAHGRAAHAGGNHELGVNAIWELAHHIPAIQSLTDYAAGTATTVGMIRGGTASNVIPDYAELTIDARATYQHDVDRMTAAIRSLRPAMPGARLELEGGFDRPAMECNAERLAILVRMTAIALFDWQADEDGDVTYLVMAREGEPWPCLRHEILRVRRAER